MGRWVDGHFERALSLRDHKSRREFFMFFNDCIVEGQTKQILCFRDFVNCSARVCDRAPRLRRVVGSAVGEVIRVGFALGLEGRWHWGWRWGWR